MVRSHGRLVAISGEVARAVADEPSLASLGLEREEEEEEEEGDE